MNLTVDDWNTLALAAIKRMHWIAENIPEHFRFDERIDELKKEIGKLQTIIAAIESDPQYQTAYGALPRRVA